MILEEHPIDYVENGGTTMNFYNQYKDQIVLDKGLEDYPLAHEYIREHEIKHREIGFNPVQQIIHEFKNDLFIYCSSSNQAYEVRDYLFKDPEPHWKLRLEDALVHILRTLWVTPMVWYGILKRKFIQ